MMNDASRRAWWLCLLLTAACMVHQRFIGADGRAHRTVISSDGEAYCAYLWGVFIDGGLDHVQAGHHVFDTSPQGRVIKGFAGTAVVQAPFFLLGHAVAKITGLPPDGRSVPYHIAIGLCGLCCMAFGLWQMRGLLRSFDVPDGTVAAVLLLLVFGTGLLYYTVMAPSMAHVPAFAGLAWSFAAVRRYAITPTSRRLLLCACAMGLVGLIRPPDVLAFIALPMLFMHGARTAAALRHLRGNGWVGLLVMLAFLVVQPLAWHAQTGAWFVQPYAAEGFLWGRPMTWSVLFGARKGLFFYWPSLLIAIPGLWYMFRRNVLGAGAWVIAISAVVYATGCWWVWYYAHSYGMRPLVDVLVLFALPMGFALDALRGRWRWVAVAVCIPLVGLQLLQTWQYQLGIIHPYAMDREKYRMILMRTDDAARGLFGGASMVEPYAPHGLDTLITSADTSFARQWKERTDADGELQLDQHAPYGPSLRVDIGEQAVGRMLHVTITSHRRAVHRGAASTMRWVCTLSKEGNDRIYQAWPLEEIPQPDDRSWRPWRHTFRTPPPLPGEKLTIYAWQSGQGTVLLSDVAISVVAPRPTP